MKEWLRHAFHVDPPGAAEPNDAQRAIVDRVCHEVARRHLTTPAIAFLEMGRPLNFVSSQLMHFFQPIVSALTDNEGYEQFAVFLEQRGSLEYICQRIEAIEDEYERRKVAASTGDDSSR